MFLLIFYVSLALGISFLCSVAEAVILSVTSAHISLLVERGSPSGQLLSRLRDDINRPLAAILTLNTIAHTVGAAGAGAQAAVVFGSNAVGIASAVLTLLILVLSEIIPKTLGAHYWKALAPVTAHTLRWLILCLYPFVKMSEWLTRGLGHGPSLKGFNRDEMAAMAVLSSQEGQLSEPELRILQNLLKLRDQSVLHVMTPRTVVFSLDMELTVDQFIEQFRPVRFSRIPIYLDGPEDIRGYVMRNELLQAHSRGRGDLRIDTFLKPIPTLVKTVRLSDALDAFLSQRRHMMFVVDEHGGMAGILTLEDVLEALIGREIVDEFDETHDMRALARRLWAHRKEQMDISGDEDS